MSSLRRFKATTSSVLADNRNGVKECINDGFKDILSYFRVYKNFDFNTPFDCLIQDTENSYKKPNMEKKIIMAPGQSVREGDYIHWSNDRNVPVTESNQGYLMIAISEDDEYPEINKAKIVRTGRFPLKWRDRNGNIQSWGCAIFGTRGGKGYDEGKILFLPEEQLYIYVQRNDNTETLEINTRFIFGKQAFRLSLYDNYTGNINNTLLKLTLDQDTVDDRDDLTNRIAWNPWHDLNYNVEILNDEIEAQIGDTIQLNAQLLYGGEVVSGGLTYRSNDTSIATISDTGLITCVANGTTSIDVLYSENQNISQSINISVVVTPVQNIVIKLEDVTNLIIDNEAFSIRIPKQYSGTANIRRWNNGVAESDTFTVNITNGTNVVQTSVSGNVLTITPLIEGNASIAISDSSGNTVNYSILVYNPF